MSKGYIDRGVYIGLPFDAYLAEPSLSTSGIKDILVSPQNYWMKHLDPTRKPRDSKSMMLGRIAHKMILEGRDAFDAEYAVQPTQDHYPNAIDGVESLKEVCAQLGLKKSGTKTEMCQRIKEVDPDIQLWPEIIGQWASDNQGKIVVKSEQYETAERMAHYVTAHPSARNAIKGGIPEVSVFWTDEETGVNMKARIDYLRPNEVIDLKTFNNTTDAPINTAAIRAIVGRRYHIQAAVYLQAAYEARKAFQQGNYHGNQISDALAESIAFGNLPHRFFFLMVESDTYEVLLKEFVREVEGATTMFFGTGERLFREGVKTYGACKAMYPVETPWISALPPSAILDSEVPLYAMGE